MFEWDQGSVNRKFAHTRAKVQIGDKPPVWMPIDEVSSDQLVYSNGNGCIGQTLFEHNGFAKLHKSVPVVSFEYAPIECGFYHHLNKAGEFYCIVRKHVKSWKIGLSNEGYNIFHYPTGDLVSHKTNIDLDRPFNASFMDYAYFGNGLIKDKNKLKYLETPLGFIDKDRIVLNDQAFAPLVAPYLGDKWQIVSL